MGLAWLRTAVSLLLVGLAVARLLGPGHPGPLGAGVLLVLVGVLGPAYGTVPLIGPSRRTGVTSPVSTGAG